MLEIGRLKSDNVRIFDTVVNNGLIIDKSRIKFMIDALTEIKEQLDEEEKEKQAQERKVNRAMERLEHIANDYNYTIVDSKEHFILVDLDEVTNSEVLTIDAIINKFIKIYLDKLVVPSLCMSFEVYTNNTKFSKIIEELQVIRTMLVK
jgi:hypothetical protein